MNKTDIRKRILEIRKRNDDKNFKINFKDLFRILKKLKSVGKIIGGYYPYNYEIDIINILKELEKKNILYLYQRLKKIFK